MSYVLQPFDARLRRALSVFYEVWETDWYFKKFFYLEHVTFVLCAYVYTVEHVYASVC